MILFLSNFNVSNIGLPICYLCDLKEFMYSLKCRFTYKEMSFVLQCILSHIIKEHALL